MIKYFFSRNNSFAFCELQFLETKKTFKDKKKSLFINTIVAVRKNSRSVQKRKRKEAERREKYKKKKEPEKINRVIDQVVNTTDSTLSPLYALPSTFRHPEIDTTTKWNKTNSQKTIFPRNRDRRQQQQTERERK